MCCFGNEKRKIEVIESSKEGKSFKSWNSGKNVMKLFMKNLK